MNLNKRMFTDMAFTWATCISVILITLALVGILLPMINKGSTAVIFDGTIEFRKMQLGIFERGDSSVIKAEIEEVQPYRNFIYERLKKFSMAVNTDYLVDQVRDAYREYGKELRHKDVSREDYRAKRKKAKDIRNRLTTAFETTDRTELRNEISYAMGFANDPDFRETAFSSVFDLAVDYRDASEKTDLTKKSEYVVNTDKLQTILAELLGPIPGRDLPPLSMHQYGATRMDMAKKTLDKLLWVEQWVSQEPGKPLVKVRTPRKTQFAGTVIEPIFDYTKNNLERMLKPEKTFYWQYFIDDSTPGHYFGGIGPEILGTVLITILAMLFAIPLGITSAAYLVECAGDNLPVKIIRMCINSLAGVPSIVFGLFGLAFFVTFLLPKLSFESKPCMLAGSLTLALLTLPVIIRASEEAIRSVPRTYKEASLGLGAGRFSTFIKVTFPSALPGILTGIILSLSRVAGETAPILFTAAVALGPVPKSILQPTRTLSYGSYDMAVGDRIATMVPHNQYGMVLTLIALILVLNGLAIIIRNRISRKLLGH